jgi:hypothetical protein
MSHLPEVACLVDAVLQAWLGGGGKSWADSHVYIKNDKHQGVQIHVVTHHKSSAHEVWSIESIILFAVLTEAKENSIYRHLKPDESYRKQRPLLSCDGDRLQVEQLSALLLGIFSPSFADSQGSNQPIKQ